MGYLEERLRWVGGGGGWDFWLGGVGGIDQVLHGGVQTLVVAMYFVGCLFLIGGVSNFVRSFFCVLGTNWFFWELFDLITHIFEVCSGRGFGW